MKTAEEIQQMSLDERCKYILKYLFPNYEKEMTALQYKNSMDALRIIATQQTEAKEKEIKTLEEKVKFWVDSWNLRDRQAFEKDTQIAELRERIKQLEFELESEIQGDK